MLTSESESCYFDAAVRRETVVFPFLKSVYVVAMPQSLAKIARVMEDILDGGLKMPKGLLLLSFG